MSGEDIVRSTMRRGFRAYFRACMPSTSAAQAVAAVEETPVPQYPWGFRRSRTQSPLPPQKPTKGFFSHVCEGEGLPDCNVCFEAIKQGESILSLRCSDTSMHTFHEHCIAPWLQDKGTCPMCRAEIL